MKKTLLTLCICIVLSTPSIASAELPANIQEKVKEGRQLIENGRYQDAAQCLGEILTSLGGSSNDPQVDSLGATVQAAGMLHADNPQYLPLAKQYLNRAIARDPSWEYPKKLLKEAEGKK